MASPSSFRESARILLQKNSLRHFNDKIRTEEKAVAVHSCLVVQSQTSDSEILCKSPSFSIGMRITIQSGTELNRTCNLIRNPVPCPVENKKV
mmetsp:Transcript_105829/g.147557  ORF Transcript_105829/g.147557 Transcript_105829/m.147557 type:complete len:93 (+) Transcript_105829:567-845(+)